MQFPFFFFIRSDENSFPPFASVVFPQIIDFPLFFARYIYAGRIQIRREWASGRNFVSGKWGEAVVGSTFLLQQRFFLSTSLLPLEMALTETVHDESRIY